MIITSVKTIYHLAHLEIPWNPYTSCCSTTSLCRRHERKELRDEKYMMQSRLGCPVSWTFCHSRDCSKVPPWHTKTFHPKIKISRRVAGTVTRFPEISNFVNKRKRQGWSVDIFGHHWMIHRCQCFFVIFIWFAKKRNRLLIKICILHFMDQIIVLDQFQIFFEFLFQKFWWTLIFRI